MDNGRIGAKYFLPVIPAKAGISSISKIAIQARNDGAKQTRVIDNGQ
ncbi:MAG: hypothetical protein LBP85_04180 [Prevotellaceae bacterium]|jgi:hypothetical protein|nr:hypothetical protein [Prevotellaceae bacterium]